MKPKRVPLDMEMIKSTTRPNLQLCHLKIMKER